MLTHRCRFRPHRQFSMINPISTGMITLSTFGELAEVAERTMSTCLEQLHVTPISNISTTFQRSEP